ncbi:phage tail protein [Citrobacter koseri]|uniref:Phage tail protein n=3 Tax=Enterobacteriaceae TaxID=543 RepID=A0AAW4EAA6_CITKO|nr:MULTISPECIES: phage tail protein [Enterobacteriaceae]MBJ9867737.1 phage tail protein [Citrobacter koseri]MCL1519484.1 phage tail protein [Enterobacter cloacae]USP98384.1 phage tail protein [Enterobacter cloacae]
MSQTAITLAFEQWKASQAVTGEPVLLDEFVFANVPGLDTSKPIDRNEALPPAAQIVHRQAVSRKGVVNENAVVHSTVLGAEVGDFSFNWIGLINKASNTLAMIVHAPLQQKLKTKDGQQGNVLTRSFLMEYNGAQAETGINTPAETWQIDFTARMAAMDERQRLENIDLYGTAAFLGNGYLVAKSGSQYLVTAGAGYVRGLRAQLAANQNITVTTKPVKVWLDVSWTGTLTSAWGVTSKITVAANLADYVQNGVQHYVFAVASIDANGNITDLRPKGTLNEQAASDALKKHEQSRNHPDATTAAKGFTQLSSALDSISETLAATPKAVKAAYDLAKGKYTAQDATTAQKGIVRLSSATDSVSELLAATPKAVKTAYDLADTANKAAKLADDNADTRLLKTSNLSDIPDKAKARSALELKTAATRDVTTSTYDTTAGRVLKNGDYGQGTDNGLALLNSIFDITCTAKYSALGVGAGANATQGMPANSGNTRFSVEADNIYTGQYWVTLRSTSQIYLGLVNTTNKTASWTQYYTELYKPTATDVDAVSASQGGVFQGQVQFRRGLRLQNSEYLAGIDYGTDAASFSGANLLLKSWYGIGFYSNYPSSGELGVMGYVNVRIGRLEMKEQIIPGNYGNFDNRYYTQAVADGRFQPKGNYTPAGQAYTKAESDGRFNLKNTASKNSNGWHKDSSTGIIIQFGSGGYTNGGRITFPIAFPNACLSVTGNDTGTGIVKVSLGARNTTGFTMYSEQSSVSLNWIAIGY